MTRSCIILIPKLSFTCLYSYVIGKKEYSVEKLPVTLNGVLFMQGWSERIL